MKTKSIVLILLLLLGIVCTAVNSKKRIVQRGKITWCQVGYHYFKIMPQDSFILAHYLTEQQIMDAKNDKFGKCHIRDTLCKEGSQLMPIQRFAKMQRWMKYGIDYDRFLNKVELKKVPYMKHGPVRYNIIVLLFLAGLASIGIVYLYPGPQARWVFLVLSVGGYVAISFLFPTFPDKIVVGIVMVLSTTPPLFLFKKKANKLKRFHEGYNVHHPDYVLIDGSKVIPAVREMGFAHMILVDNKYRIKNVFGKKYVPLRAKDEKFFFVEGAYDKEGRLDVPQGSLCGYIAANGEIVPPSLGFDVIMK